LSRGQVGATAYGGRIVVVVDSDVDVTDVNDVLWALTTRMDPQRDVQVIKRAWSGPVDSAVDPDERPFNSRLILDATRPWGWRDRFPKTVITPAQAQATRERWGWILERGAGS
jgi:3-polyprenyl-4-hydroxybenzoate decarboxylase